MSSRQIRVITFIVLLAVCGFSGSHQAVAQTADQQSCSKDSGDVAIAACSRAIRQNPKDANAYYNRGIVWMNKGENDIAIADYNEAIRLNPKHAIAYNNRGVVWERKGDNDKAFADYNESIRLNPQYTDAYNNRGIVWMNKGDNDKAIADYNEAIRLNPQYANAYHNRGVAWYNKKEYDIAILDYKEALRTDPNHKLAAANMKLALAEKAKQGSSVASAPVQQQQQVVVQQQQQAVTSASSGKRVALVIGNTRYKYAPMLENPKNDAALLGSTLRETGFQSVTVKYDLTREQMIQALKDFAPIADSADWAVIYFSGHGVEFGGSNYMIPIDASLKADRDIELETINVGQVLNAIEGANRLRLVILDMCRSNPFVNSMRRTMASRSLGKGLASIEPEKGTLVAYAAKHGAEASDGTGTNNSPFLEALVKRIKQTPPQEVRRLFDLVRDDVLVATQKKQQPYSYGSLSGSEDFFFTR